MLCNLYLNHLAGILSIVIYVCMFGICADDYESDLRQESKKKMSLSLILRCVYLRNNNLKPSLRSTVELSRSLCR